MAERIRVVQVMEAVVAGTQRHLLDLAFGLDTERFRQYLVVSLQRDPGFAELLPLLTRHGTIVVEVPMSRSIAPLRDWRALRGLIGVVRSLRPDIVHGHAAKGGFLARLAARSTGARAIYTPHVLPFRKYRSRLKRWAYRALERYAARGTDFLVAVSESEREAALAARLLPPDRIVLIPNGILVDQYRCPERRLTVRQSLGVDEAAILVGAVGNLRPQKDYETLVKAAALVGAERPIRFVIAGEGPLRPVLTSLIDRLGLADRFVLLGWYDDTPGLLAALDLFVMSSWYEGCPYGLLEAMASGTPIVATAVPGIAEVAVDGEYGRLAPGGDPRALAQAIGEAIAQPEASRQMAARAQQVVSEEYNVQTMLARTAELYERCADRR